MVHNISHTVETHTLLPLKDATGMYVFHTPCIIGDIVWGIRHRNGVPVPTKGKVTEMFFVGSEMKLCIVVRSVIRGLWGVNVFATKEEAERAIMEG